MVNADSVRLLEKHNRESLANRTAASVSIDLFGGIQGL